MLLLSYEEYLTNRLQFSMVFTLIDRRNDVIKCSKLKWNQEKQAGEWFHCKVLNIFWRHFYGLYGCRPQKIVVDLLNILQNSTGAFYAWVKAY